MNEKAIPSYKEALQMLADKAGEGSVTAIVALERALRNRSGGAEEEIDDALDRLLSKDE